MLVARALRIFPLLDISPLYLRLAGDYFAHENVFKRPIALATAEAFTNVLQKLVISFDLSNAPTVSHIDSG